MEAIFHSAFFSALFPIAAIPATGVSVPEDLPPQVSTSIGMLFACWSIVIVLGAMFFVFMRAGKKEYAVAILPLLIVPLMHIVSGPVARWFSHFLPLTSVEIRVALDLTAGLISCLLIGVSSRRITASRSRTVFSFFCSGFIIILALVLVINVLMAARV